MLNRIKLQALKDVLTTNLAFDKSRLDFRILCYNSKFRRMMDVWRKKTIREKVRNFEEIFEFLNSYNGVSIVEKRLKGEVNTPFWFIEKILNDLPKNFWEQSRKILEPANGTGNFVAVLVYRFMYGFKHPDGWETKGLSELYENEEERYKYIMEEMIHVCDIQPKNMFFYELIFNPDGTLKLKKHVGSFLEQEFNDKMKEWSVNHFDLSTSNPPYNEEFKNNNNRVKPLYDKFILKSLNFSNYLLYIIPSRWMYDAYGLQDFKKFMLNRKDIKIIHHYSNASEIFDNVEIKGGVSSILIDTAYNGDVIFNDEKRKTIELTFSILEKSILKKTSIIDQKLSSIIKSQSYYGFPGNESLFTKEKISDNDIIVYVSKNKGLKMWVNESKIRKNANIISWKVFIPGASGSGSKMSIFGNKIIGQPNEVASKSYMVFLLNSKLECENLILYLNTKFANYLLGTKKKTQNIKPDTLSNIPLMDLSKSWTDEELYKYFDLTPEEIKLIEDTVK